MFTGPLEDRVAIQELNGTYADGVVRIDAATWATVWADDADWDLMGHQTKGKERSSPSGMGPCQASRR